MPQSYLRVSIVLATYNGARYLPQQLKSLADQTRLPDELIISDDGSTDDTLALAHAFAESAPFPTRVHRTPTNLGAQQNFGTALALATGDVLLPCDQDDVWHADKVATVADVFEHEPEVGLTLNDAELVNPDLQPLHRTLWGDLRIDAARQDAIDTGRGVDVFWRGIGVYGCTMGLRATWRDQFLPIPPGTHFDSWMARVVAVCAPCRLIRRPLQVYRQHAGQIQGLKLERMGRLARAYRIWNNSDATNLAGEVDGLRTGLAKLATLPDTPARAIATTISTDRLRLAERRLTIKRSLLRRVPLVARSVVDGSYHRSAKGWLSAGVDLVSKPQGLL